MDFDSLLDAESATIPTSVSYVRTAFHTSAAVGGGATYRRVSSAPAHNGSFQSADGAWWELFLPSVSPEMFGAVGNGDVMNMAADTYACQDAVDFSAATGIPVKCPPATYVIDGYKGARPTWTNGGRWTHGGIVIPNGAILHGAGRGATTFRNGADNWRSILRVREGNTQIRHLAIDGDFPARPEISYDGTNTATTGVIRGCTFIFEGGNVIPMGVDIKDIQIMNSGGYGIGFENINIGYANVDGVYLKKIGADGIDIKWNTSPDYDKNLYINNIFAEDGCGHNYIATGEEGGHDDQAVVDIGGKCNVSNVFIKGLTCDPDSTGNTGVRLRSVVTSTSRMGAQGSTVTNVFVQSSKEQGMGSDIHNRIIGLAVYCSDVSISNVYVENAYCGAIVAISGTAENDDLRDIAISNILVKNANGIQESGIGLLLSPVARGVTLTNVRVKDSDIGLQLDGLDGAFHGLMIRDCALGIKASKNIWRNYTISGLHLNGNIVDTDDLTEVIGSAAIVDKRSSIVADRRVWHDFISLANDSSWSGEDGWLGGSRFFGTDTSGTPGEIARTGLLATGPSGAAYTYVVRFGSANVFQVRPDRVMVSTTVLGNYADDAAAAVAGVLVGGLYRTGSTIKVRVA